MVSANWPKEHLCISRQVRHSEELQTILLTSDQKNRLVHCHRQEQNDLYSERYLDSADKIQIGGFVRKLHDLSSLIKQGNKLDYRILKGYGMHSIP